VCVCTEFRTQTLSYMIAYRSVRWTQYKTLLSDHSTARLTNERGFSELLTAITGQICCFCDKRFQKKNATQQMGKRSSDWGGIKPSTVFFNSIPPPLVKMCSTLPLFPFLTKKANHMEIRLLKGWNRVGLRHNISSLRMNKSCNRRRVSKWIT